MTLLTGRVFFWVLRASLVGSLVVLELKHMNPNTFEPEPTGANRFGQWLTVQDAVTYCAAKGLNRTPKTIRKWAHRSHSDPNGADLVVRCEDVENGFRWSIEQTSLDRKIEQELEFELRRQAEPDETGQHPAEPVRTSAPPEVEESRLETLAEPDQPGAHQPEPVFEGSAIVEQLQERIADLQEEVAFYREELRDRRNATTALTDVIETFRLTALNNAQTRRLRPTSYQDEDTSDPSTGDTGHSHDIRMVE